jgi:hypothetical protein
VEVVEVVLRGLLGAGLLGAGRHRLLDLVKAVRQHPLVERVVEKLRLELGRVDALPSGRVPGSSGGIARLAMNGRSR